MLKDFTLRELKDNKPDQSQSLSIVVFKAAPGGLLATLASPQQPSTVSLYRLRHCDCRTTEI